MFSTFVGIDQTGAAVRGVPRPLPAALLAADGSLHVGELGGASRAEITAFAGGGGDRAILVDAVIGLPGACWDGGGPDEVWKLFATTHGAPGYGRAVAEAFFAPFAPTSGDMPRRDCEKVANANSVLRTRPYQKNIQTGTFRIWKDLTSEGARWVNVWPYEARPRRELPWLFEGYPSWMWTRVFGFAKRSPERIRELVRRAEDSGIRVRAPRSMLASIAADPDLADAVALAVGGACLHAGGKLLAPFDGFERHPERRREGWIVGVTGA